MKTKHGAMATLLLALGALGGCGPSDSAAASATNAAEVVIGAPWPWAARGEILYRQGMEMAVDEVNAEGGIDGRALRLLFEDDQESVNEGLRVAQRLAGNAEVAAVIGHLQSYVTVPAASIYEGAGLVLLSPTSTDPALTSAGYDHVFRSIATDAQTGREMAEYAASQGYRRLAIYYVRSDYGRGLANAFEEHSSGLGISIVARSSYEPASTLDPRSFEPTLREWQRLEIDAVFLAAEVPLAGHLIALMRSLGLHQPVLGGDAMSIPGLIRAGGEAVEGTVVAAAFHAGEPRPEVERFARAFHARFGADPDPGAALAYDAVWTVARALRLSGPSPRSGLAAALRSMESWTGVTGPISFQRNGDLAGRGMVKLVVRDGRFQPLTAAGGSDEE